MDGKRPAQQQGGPPAKRGPSNPDFDDDMYDDDLAGDDIAATLPDDLDEADPELGEAGRNWKRPPVAPLDPQKDSLGMPGLACCVCWHGILNNTPWQPFLCMFWLWVCVCERGVQVAPHRHPLPLCHRQQQVAVTAATAAAASSQHGAAC